MSACSSNVVTFAPRTLEQINLFKQRVVEMSRDQQALTELSLHLKGIRRNLVAEASVFDAVSGMVAEQNLKQQAEDLIEQIEVLEAGINKLIGAMATYQPR